MAAVVHLNRKLVLEEAERVSDGAGGYVETWVRLGTLWAAIRSGSGSTTSEDFLTLSKVAMKIMVRAAPVGSQRRPKLGHRLIEGALVCTSLAVSETDALGHYLTCTAREEVTS